MNHALVLASNSPRRRFLLRRAGLDFRVMQPQVEEVYPSSLPVVQVPEFLARLKAQDVSRMLEIEKGRSIIVAADTIVLFQEKIFGKPKDTQHALDMLMQLSGHMHEVITGVCLQHLSRLHTFSETTRVHFRQLPPDALKRYVDEAKPFDKAGAYAIQEWIGIAGIDRIEGSYTNVVGLPVSRLLSELEIFEALINTESSGVHPL
jgi:septum formation protein